MHFGSTGDRVLFYRAAVRSVFRLYRLQNFDIAALPNAGSGGNSANRRVYGNMRGAAEKILQHKISGADIGFAEFFHEYAADKRRFAGDDNTVHASDV